MALKSCFVWSDFNGQDDLVWYIADSNGKAKTLNIRAPSVNTMFTRQMER